MTGTILVKIITVRSSGVHRRQGRITRGSLIINPTPIISLSRVGSMTRFVVRINGVHQKQGRMIDVSLTRNRITTIITSRVG
jgi:hypothetical protein